MLQKLKERKNQGGFTIIEVLIVLAIAGLILLVVFLAVPALQRNSRNTQRNNDVSKLIGALNEFVNNNNGQLPTGTCSMTTCAFTTNAKLGFYDQATAGTLSYARNTSAVAVAAPATTDTSTIHMGSFSTCNAGGTASVGTNASSRSVAVVYNIETGSGTQTQCKTAQ